MKRNLLIGCLIALLWPNPSVSSEQMAYTVNPVLSRITGVEVRIPDKWMYGKNRGFHGPERAGGANAIYLRPKVHAKIAATLQGKFPPSWYTAAAWHLLAHEYGHQVGIGHERKGAGSLNAADKFAFAHMKLLMKRAGLPKEMRDYYFQLARDKGFFQSMD